MLLVGLTGGVGMGKSTVADYLIRRGEPVIDTDLLARELVAPGQPALRRIAECFGPRVLGVDGALDRASLAAVVFANEDSRRALESILHPLIRNAWREQVARWREAGTRRVTVVIPLLFETAAETEFNQIVCVACSEDLQQRRLRERGWSGEEIERRNRAQWRVQKKMDRADGVIWNEGAIGMCEEQCRRLLKFE